VHLCQNHHHHHHQAAAAAGGAAVMVNLMLLAASLRYVAINPTSDVAVFHAARSRDQPSLSAVIG